MKKVLIASTALVAAGLMTTGTASASEKIKLQLGGFSKWWVVGKWNDSSYENAVASSYNNVDIVGDNEVHFTGSTTLDNGLKVGVQIELEAGGHYDMSQDPIDASFVFVEGGFGKVLLGTAANGTALLHVTAPDAAGNWNGDGLMQTGVVVQQPAGVFTTPYVNPANTGTFAVARNGLTTAIITDNKADKITYVAPSFYGLTVGASYVPNLFEDSRIPTGNDTEAMGAGALYANTFGGVGVKLSAGVVSYDVNPADATVNNTDRTYEHAYGGQLSYAGFTLGGSYKRVSTNFSNTGPNVTSSNGTGSTLSEQGDAWDVGLQYANGPYAVSVAYFRSSVEGSRTVQGTDDIELWQVSGKYNLGPGVDLLGSVGYMKYEDELTAASNNNKGWGVMTGLSLSF